MDGTLKISVIKSRPGQLVGLTLEEQDNRIMVTDVCGLFKNLPVHVGDQVVEVNKTPVTSKEEFPRGLKDVQMFLRREWHICVTVKKGLNADRGETAKDKPVETYGIVAKETKKWNSEDRDKTAATTEDSDSEDSSINLSDDDDDDDEQTTNSKDRRSRSAKPRRKRAQRSSSPFSAFTRNEKRKGKKKTSTQLKALDDSVSDSLSATTGTTASMSTDYDTPPRTEARTCQNGTLVDIDENDSVLISPLSPDQTTKPKSQGIEIKSIHGTDHGITLELDDGNTVSISPEQLLAAVSEHKGLDDSLLSLGRNLRNSSAVGAPSVWDPNEKPKSKVEKTKSKKLPGSPKKDKPKIVKAPRRSSMPLMLPSESSHSQSKAPDPSALSLRNLLNDSSVRMSISTLLAQHTDKISVDKPSSHSSRISAVDRTSPSTKEFMNELRKAPKATRRTSMPMLDSESSHRTPLTSIREGEQLSKASKLSKKKRSKSPDSLPDETSMHSTHSCFTNLIDPGDLMKIRGFKSKPKMNNATVEVIRKSKGHNGKRWDVRVISQKHIKNTSFNAKRLISVSSENLQHFR